MKTMKDVFCIDFVKPVLRDHRVFQAKEALKKDIKIASLENDDMKPGKMLTSSVDVWLNIL